MAISYKKWFTNQKNGLKGMERQGMLFALSMKMHNQNIGSGFNLVDQNNFSSYDTSWIDFKKYRVVVWTNKNSNPLVKIVSGLQDDQPPHIYKEGYLCLYHPSEGIWSENSLISKDILPLIYTWVYFYEVWQVTAKWFGREYEH